MAAALLLDLLIFLVPVMLIPLGLWRGGPHEVIVGGGILLGWAVSTEWAGAWGGGLASLTGTTADAMSFVVACALLVVGAGIGHLGGTLMGLPRPEADGRIAGAVLAWLNGVLFLTLALGIYGRQLDGANPMPLIERGFLTQAMIDHQGALLLGIALIVGGLLATVLWVNAAVSHVYDPTYVPGRRTAFTANPTPAEPPEPRAARTDPRRPIVEPYSTWPTAPKQRPVAVPHHADAGKVEPEPEFSRFRTALSRIGPASAGGEPSRRTTIAEMFAQSLPVDLRDRGARASDSPAAETPGMSRPSADRPASPRPAPDRGAADRSHRGGAAGRAAGARSGEGAEDPPAPCMAPPREAGQPQSPIGEWLRVASGMANPMITSTRDDRAARRPVRSPDRAAPGDGVPNDPASPADHAPRLAEDADADIEDVDDIDDVDDVDDIEDVDDAAPRRA